MNTEEQNIPEESTEENTADQNTTATDQGDKASNKPEAMHVHTVTPDDGGEAPENDEEDNEPSATTSNEDRPEGDEDPKADEPSKDQNEKPQSKPEAIDIPTVTPGDSADPGITDGGEQGNDTSQEHPFHAAAEAEKDAGADTEENEQDADETSNKDAGPKGENL